jgi:chromosome segregation ATPase
MIEKTRRFYKLKEETAAMKKHVNVRVDNMADQAEKDYTELIKKKDRVMIDKDSIEKTIAELDALKNQTLNSNAAPYRTAQPIDQSESIDMPSNSA